MRLVRDPEPEASLLLAGFSEAETEAQRRRFGDDVEVEAAPTEAEVIARFERGEVAVLALGPGFSGHPARQLLESLRERFPESRTLHLLASGGPDPAVFQELIDEDRIFFLSLQSIGGEDLSALLESAISRFRTLRVQDERTPPKAASSGPSHAEGLALAGTVPLPVPKRDERAELSRRVLTAAGRLAGERDPAAVAYLVREDLADLIGAARAHVLLYDAETEVLWERRGGMSAEERRESAAVGVVSFVARTGRAVSAARLADDPRYEREADDPEGNGQGPFAAIAVRDPTAGGSSTDGPAPMAPVIAVLAALRDPGSEPFSAADRAALSLYAERAAPALAQLALEARLVEQGKREERQMREGALDVFREEALDFHMTSARKEGDLLRISPVWIDWASWLLLGLAGVGLLFLIFGRIHERSTGVAVIRLGGRSEITATAAGTVASVEAPPGTRVAEGATLVHLYGGPEAAELSQLEGEFELQLASRLRDPGDRGAEAALIGLSGQIELAKSRLAERDVRAPRAGVVADIRVRAGQQVVPGQVIASLSTGAQAGGAPRVAVLLPGKVRPQLETGLPIRLELDGFRYAYQRLQIESVSDEVLGPEEARRLLGSGVGEGAQIAGPVVFAWARLPDSGFTVDGRRYAFYDGMWGTAEVSLRSEPLATALIPGLRVLLGGGRR
jgi:hypothetical protein